MYNKNNNNHLNKQPVSNERNTTKPIDIHQLFPTRTEQ